MVGLKHFAMNSLEILRDNVNVKCEEKDMNEHFLQHFKDVLSDDEPEMIMCAGNLVNGVACAENKTLLNGVLRQQWLMDAVLVASDCTWPLENGLASIKAGLDIELPFDEKSRIASIERALEHSALEWTEIQIMAKRVIACQLKYYSRTIRMPLPDTSHIRCPRHVSLARQAAAESMVLLKNKNGLLPLDDKKNFKMAVIGVLADSVSTSHQFDPVFHSKGPTGTSPLEELRKQHNLVVEFAADNQGLQAAHSAKTADVVLLFVRATSIPVSRGKYSRIIEYIRPRKSASSRRYDIPSVAYRDRAHLSLNSNDLGLAKTVLSVAGNKTIVVIEAGSSVLIPTFIRERAIAILFFSYGCRQSAKAVRDVLFGEQEPSGRLPFFLPDTKSQLLDSMDDEASGQLRYDNQWGYRKLQSEQQKPAYPFGFGLGYSTFQIKSLWCSQLISKSTFVITAKVGNTGTRVAKAVVQMYAAEVSSRKDSVLRTSVPMNLVGFAKQSIMFGEEIEFSITCRLTALAKYHAETKKMYVDAGEYQLHVGQFEGDTKAVTSSFRIASKISC